jgi:hypothetical protein
VDTRRRERQRAAQDEGAGAQIMAGDAVRQVDDACLRCDARHDRVADADEVVRRPVVGQEGDDHSGGGYARGMPERTDAPLADEPQPGAIPNDVPSGLPEGVEESAPMGRRQGP